MAFSTELIAIVQKINGKEILAVGSWLRQAALDGPVRGCGCPSGPEGGEGPLVADGRPVMLIVMAHFAFLVGFAAVPPPQESH